MNPLDRLDAFLRHFERWLRFAVLSRGAALAAGTALAATVLLVLFANSYAFSDASVNAARFALAVALALAVCLGLCLPLLAVNRRASAHWLERRFPVFDARLVTFAETAPDEPFLPLLAADTAPLAETIEATPRTRIVAFSSAAAAATGCLMWLVAAGPGFMGYGASLLWAGPPRAETRPFYDVLVSPGNQKVRRGADQLVTAQPVGMEPPGARLLARYRAATKWEEAPMQPSAHGSGFQFLFAGIPETAEYYVEAGGVRSKTYTLTVVDLPAVKKIRVTYRFPGWTGLKDAVEDPGGDLRAVEGTEAEVAVLTDRPLRGGMLAFDNDARSGLEPGDGNWVKGRVAIQKDGIYHIAVNDGGQEVRLSEDFFIEARKPNPPLVRVVRPGRDVKVTPIEEMTVGVEADDEFALQDMSLHYSVNGGPEKTVPLLKGKGAKKADGAVTLYLEDYKLAPGDVVSLYASARNARETSDTDMMFIETQPFEREYSQSQAMGGGQGMGGGDQDENRISARQKEIIAATWNEMRDRKDSATAAENGKFLAGVESKLRDQARSLAQRMARRQLSGANDEFSSFGKDMNAAAEDMNAASAKLKAQAWKDALPAEQQALQHLLRAEATFRQIQVAFGQRGGGAGGGRGAARDLENLFDLELDTEKNQYETGQQAASAEQRSREVDEALQKLEQLARRQQELAQQTQQNRQNFEQRWQQELLRREAEELQRQLQQMAGGQQSGGDARLSRALDRLQQAARDMRSQSGGGEARRAADRLEEARQIMRGLRGQQSSEQVGEISRNAERLPAAQRDFASRLQQAFPNPPQLAPRGLYGGRRGFQLLDPKDRDKAAQLGDERQKLAAEYDQLERQIQEAVRSLASSQRAASSKMRDALGDAQKNELGLRMKYNAEYIRRGLGAYAVPREAPITQGLEQLAGQMRQAQSALDERGGGSGMERALSNVERLRAAMERAARQGGENRGNWSAINRGDLPEPELGRAFAQGLRDLGDLRRAVIDNPEMVRDVQELIREMQGLDPKRFPGNPALIEQLASRLLPAIEGLEVQLRRSLDQAGQPVRAGAAEPVPPGYAEAVADYFRRLSKPR